MLPNCFSTTKKTQLFSVYGVDSWFPYVLPQRTEKKKKKILLNTLSTQILTLFDRTVPLEKEINNFNLRLTRFLRLLMFYILSYIVLVKTRVTELRRRSSCL